MTRFPNCPLLNCTQELVNRILSGETRSIVPYKSEGIKTGDVFALLSDKGQRVELRCTSVFSGAGIHDRVTFNVASTADVDDVVLPEPQSLLVAIATRPDGAPPLVNFIPAGLDQAERLVRYFTDLPRGCGAPSLYAIDSLDLSARFVGYGPRMASVDPDASADG